MARFVQPADAHRFRDGIADFGHVQILDGPPGRRLVLPASLAVHALEEHAVVLIGTHRDGRVSHPAIGRAPVLVWFNGVLAHGDHHDLTIFRYPDPFDGGKGRRLDPGDFGTHVLDRPLAHLLANRVAFRRDAEQYMAALLVEHGADSPRSLATRTCRGLELQRLGFSRRNHRCNPLDRHARAPLRSRPEPAQGSAPGTDIPASVPAHRQASIDMVLLAARRPSMMRQAPWVSPPVTTMSISDSWNILTMSSGAASRLPA